MSTLSNLLAEKARLEAEINRVRSQEVETAIQQCQELITEFGLTSEMLFVSKGRKAKGMSYATREVAPKYRNPATGDTWSGRGKPPLWIKDQDRAQFLIEA